MIQRLRIKMILTIMFFITVILVVLVAVLNLVPVQQSRSEAKSFLQQIANSGRELRPGTEKPEGQRPPRDVSRFFGSNLVTAEFDRSGELLHWTSDRQDIYNEDYILQAAAEIFQTGKEFDVYEGCYYLCRSSGPGTILVLMDNSMAFESARSMLVLTIVSGVLVWILLLGLSIVVVNKMTRPVVEAFARQRQFISDAGHELKTPVAVISANAEVLEQEIGENKWLSYIHAETRRMDKLIRNLMMLAEIDDSTKTAVHTRISLSQTVLGATLPFESLAFENGIIMQTEVEPDIWLWGNQEQLEQLVAIFLSNAIKYGGERGIIRISLSQQHKTVRLSVFNTGMGIEPEELSKIFERFYRVDKDRSRKSGSYGLGLAIARSIAQEHRAKITVDSHYGESVQFTVEFPKNVK